MASLSQVIDQIAANGLPSLPHGHPVLDGKIKRFGPGKKAWYALREILLPSGKSAVNGAFGIWQGQEPNSVSVKMEWEGVSAEDRLAAEKKQAQYEAAAAEKKTRVAELAANRARQQWQDAAPVAQRDAAGYLVRKAVDGDTLRVDAAGVLLIPMRKYTPDGARLAGLQKIAPDGQKRFSTGMDKQGTGFLLGSANQESPLIALGEGYATCETVRMATECVFPVMVGFDAGNLMHNAQQLRRDFPDTHLLMLADDDVRLVPRFAEYLLKEFKVNAAPPIDGADHNLADEDGGIVRVRAQWRRDGTGTEYIEADIRAGRLIRMTRFENAGISRSRAAAKAVGNASVVCPVFADRGDGDSDFNDLYLGESLDVVRVQVQAAVDAALAGAVQDECNAGPVTDGVPDRFDDAPADSPAPPSKDDLAGIRIPELDTLLAHFSLIYPTTDVWDGLRKQRLKRGAFAAWVGKDVAAKWEKDGKRRTILRESLPMLVGGRAVEGGAGGGKIGEMLDNITLLRGTETVWDAIGQQVMSLGALRADYTAELTGKWQEHPLRKTIHAKNLVFDPTQQADPVTHVNIFLGWPLTPRADAELVLPILALLESLCDAEENADECVTWILRWLAYPLQFPGAKMQTALLMFGEKQGTGKSLFFQDVMAPIYGEYGTVASQHQLDSSFTAWRSRKLFVLFEEVLSRDDKYSHNGTLKYMVTGKDMSINQKNLPERTERNHMNAAFLSNEPQPIPLELEDRRFFVIEARRKQAKEFYDAVQASIDKGGIEAFYHFLLNFPLGDFNEQTKPMMTLAKERVIEFGLNGWMSFHRAWQGGYLVAPYCSCLTEDLFIMYRRWCDKTGEKPLTLCKFSGLIAGREHKVKRNVAVGKKGKTTRMVYEIKAEGESETLEQQIERFRDLSDIRADGGHG